MKRQTVLRMLKNRLFDAQWSIKAGKEHDGLTNILGDTEFPEQFYINIQNDINELEYLIECLKEYKLKTNTYGSSAIY